MFLRIYFYKLKELSQKPWLVGWNMVFPLVLATAFFLGFGNMIKNDPNEFSTINVGYVNADSNSYFKTVLDELSKDTKDRKKILTVTEFCSKDKALESMNDGLIDGFYIDNNDDIETIVPSNGITSTTLNQIVREYDNTQIVIKNIAKDNPQKLDYAIAKLTESVSFLKEHEFGNNVSPYLNYFFSLLSMSCLFASWISTAMLNGFCANLTNVGMRFECSPSRKMPAITAGILAGLTLQSFSNTIAILYMEHVLGINFGISLWNSLLITTLGSGVGICTGVLIGAVIKNQTLRVTIPLAFSMTCSFFSGLMVGQIKQIIQYHCPIINKINPAALITDSLYICSAYGKTKEYYTNLLIMVLIIVLSLFISSFCLRRRSYDSI